MNWNAYIRLMRFNKPVGILLLWFPTAWALWTANHGAPTVKLLLLFFAGTVLMRAAGCVMNDIADRNIDRYVKRTESRPLTRKELHLKEALILLLTLLIAAFLILLQLNIQCFYWGIIALCIAFIYPFCKRWFEAPQVILGLAFSMGIPMAYSASQVPINYGALWLFIINFLWILAYDTAYAIVDKEDDLKIGVRSTAILFGAYDKIIIATLLISTHLLWLIWQHYVVVNFLFDIFWLICLAVVILQIILINKKDPFHSFRAFQVSIYYGMFMWLAIGLGLIVL